MGFWRRVAAFFGFEVDGGAPTFAIDAGSIPAQIFGLETYNDPIGPAARVSRREAIQVPAVKRGRDLIA